MISSGTVAELLSWENERMNCALIAGVDVKFVGITRLTRTITDVTFSAMLHIVRIRG
jgi:hypothetical protein